jgi:hypothetical protein
MKTKPLITKFGALLYLTLIFSAPGCSFVKTLGHNAINGAADGLDDPKNKQKVVQFANSLVDALNESLKPKALALENTLVNQRIIKWTDSLVEAISGKKIQANSQALQKILVGKTKGDILEIRNSIQSLIDDLLSGRTNYKLGLIRDNLLGPKTYNGIGNIRDEILGPKTVLAVGNLRDQLLGAKTDTAISHIVDNAAKKFVDRVNPALQGDISFVSKNATWLLITMGAIALVIIGFVWWNKTRYERMVTLLTKHINNIPNQGIYDSVTSKIKNDAVDAGLEPRLRKILSANGLTGDTNWKKQVEHANK